MSVLTQQRYFHQTEEEHDVQLNFTLEKKKITDESTVLICSETIVFIKVSATKEEVIAHLI